MDTLDSSSRISSLSFLCNYSNSCMSMVTILKAWLASQSTHIQSMITCTYLFELIKFWVCFIKVKLAPPDDTYSTLTIFNHKVGHPNTEFISKWVSFDVFKSSKLCYELIFHFHLYVGNAIPVAKIGFHNSYVSKACLQFSNITKVIWI